METKNCHTVQNYTPYFQNKVQLSSQLCFTGSTTTCFDLHLEIVTAFKNNVLSKQLKLIIKEVLKV